MTFSVTYRDKNGNQTIDMFDAESREVLFKLLATRGIAAIRIAEGIRNMPKRRKANRAGIGGKSVAIAVTGIAALTCIILAVKFFPAEKGEPKTKARTKNKIATVAPAAAPAPTQTKPDSRTTVEPVTQIKSETVDNTPDVVTNADGVVSYKNGPKFVIPPPKTPTIFNNLVDSTIASALAVQPGEHVYLSIPDDFDKRFNDIIGSTTIFIKDDDDEDTIQLKADVVEVKRQLKECMAKGESPKQVMENELKELGKLAETYNYFKTGLQDLRQSGAPMQERQEYVDAANQVMSRYNVFKKMSLSLDETIELKMEQKNAR